LSARAVWGESFTHGS